MPHDLWENGVGADAVAILAGSYLGPLVANTDGFWGAIGWTCHQHPDPLGTSLFVFEP